MKRLICALIAIALLLVPMNVFAAETSRQIDVDRHVVQQTLKDEQVAGVLTVVPLGDSASPELRSDFTAEQLSHAKAILITRMLDLNRIEQTYMIPYKELPDGRLVNSFVYAEMVAETFIGTETKFYDATVTDLNIRIQGYADRYGYTVYQEGGYPYFTRTYMMRNGTMRWTRTNPSSQAAVTKIQFTSGIRGDLYTYPGGVLITKDCHIESNTMTVNSPTQNIAYSTNYAMGGNNQAVHLVWNYTCFVRWRFDYKTTNGTAGPSQDGELPVVW